MCGITGIYSFRHNIEPQLPFIQWALKSMHHRGPDANGIWSNNKNYISGFVRLAIRDLSENGNQPMLSNCGNYVLTFNGEIYNTQPFKVRLQKQGVHFRSTTDTEVLLYALINWGEQYVLEHFDGIFAFAFYNANTNTLLLARDRSGIKPLYIGHSSEGLIYSSQYDHIINHSYIKQNAVHTGALGAYLSLGYVPENAGIIHHTFLLPHGYCVKVNSSGFTTEKFYQYPVDQKNALTHSLENVLENSVKEQLISDVPVGTFMSGGVDSPLVSYYAKQHSNLQSFTIGVNDSSIDESAAAQAYADIFKTTHYCKQITESDLLSTINDNTKAFTEPFADFSSIPTLILSKFAREKVTVALSGDGGDELFWGYPRNPRMLKEGMVFRQHTLEKLLTYGKEKLSGTRITRRRHFEVKDFPAYYYRSLFITGAEQWLPQLYEHAADPAFFLQELYKQPEAKEVTENRVMNVLRKLEFDIHLQRILLKVDRASMYHSLEVRVPVLSNSMIDYSTTLSYKDCIVNNQGKYNLKELLITKANKDLVLKPKKGFVIPIGRWLNNQLKKDVQEKLMNMPSELQMHFNSKTLEKLLNQHHNQHADWGWLLWSLYALVNWHQQHRNAS